jgi:hypothetical protein
LGCILWEKEFNVDVVWSPIITGILIIVIRRNISHLTRRDLNKLPKILGK